MKPNVSIACLAALVASAPALAASVRVETPWLRETAPAAKAGGGYAVIRNAGKVEDRLLGGSTAVAASVDVHSMTMDGNIMRMRPVSGGLAIAPGGSVALKPGGYHLMLMGLKRPLKRGETVTITLRFAKAGDVPVRFRVEPIDHQLGGGHDHH
ncbi:MAG: copper chaperone PCu(A)C [Pseudomonadota bacterium]|uniref:copper chaperone PCu(A)C n=1 Tax=Rhizorhabdus phycosphaerae TaxID=2711156 RepID=UPI0013EB4834|nr:copper chaperone PCu(A)C [Rhizorhabdus phycosphaerae]